MKSKHYFALLLFLSVTVSTYGNIKSDTTLANNYLDKGLKLLKEGNYDSSYYYYELSAEIFKESDHKLGYGKALTGMGLALHFPGKSKEALPVYLLSFEVLSKILPENDPFIIDLYNNIGACYTDQGKRFTARQYLEKALELNREVYGDEDYMTAVTRYNLGLSCMYFGETYASLQHFMSALPPYLEKFGQNGARVAQLYTNVGLNHRNLGDYETAKDYYQRAINIHLANHGENYWNLAYPYTSLGELYNLTGNKNLALDYFKKALKLTDSKDRDLTRLRSIIFGILGKYHGEKGQYTLGMEYVYRAIDLIKTTYFDDHPRLNDFYRIAGNVSKTHGDFEDAKEWYDKAIENVINNYGMLHPLLSKTYYEEAEMFLELGDTDAALISADAGIQSISPNIDSRSDQPDLDLHKILDVQQYLSLIALKGRIYRRESEVSVNREIDLSKALEQYILASKAVDHIRQGLLADGSKLFLQEHVNPIYESAIQTCYQLYNITLDKETLAHAFYFMEKSKAVILSEAIRAAEIREIQGIPSEILVKEKEIDRYIHSLELRIANSEKDAGDSLINAHAIELFHAKISRDSLTRVIHQKYPNYHQLKYEVEVVPLVEVQEDLEKGTIILSYFEGDSAWYSMGISQEQVLLNEIAKTKMNNINLKKVRSLMSDGTSDLFTLNELSYQVYEKFVEPQLQIPAETNRIIVIPDGALGYLPFDALPMDPLMEKDELPKPTYLIEKYTISYANSMTLRSQEIKFKRNKKYAGFAPEYSSEMLISDASDAYRDVLSDIPGTQEEVQEAGDIFKGDVYLNSRASEYNFKNLTESPAILHLAMHALVDDKDPMNSTLIFSQKEDTVEDGYLKAYEIYGIHLGSQLAVLSACNSGYGEMHRGEGIMSLSRAFRYAGCPNIVMSLWKAKDQPTKEIMTAFFKNLKEELPKDEALRMAKLNYLRNADPLKSHPANWATFILLGNSEPLNLGFKIKKYWVYSLAAFFIITAFIYYQRNKKKNKG